MFHKINVSKVLLSLEHYSKEIGILGIKNFETKEYFNDIIHQGFDSFLKENKFARAVYFKLFNIFPTFLMDDDDDVTINLFEDLFPLDIHLIKNLRVFDNDTKYPLAFYILICDGDDFKISFEKDIYLDNVDTVKIKITSNISFVKNIAISGTGYHIEHSFLNYINNNYFDIY